MQAVKSARLVHVRGTVQGVGFRPFVYRLAMRHGINGWVLNGEDGVIIHAEGDEAALDQFLAAMMREPPPAARIADVEVARIEASALRTFVIRESERRDAPTVRVSPDLPVCDECLRELFDPNDRRYRYPYINCTNCGPRYSIVQGLPYDRAQTTMAPWPMCAQCRQEYSDPSDRRFHAQPVACPQCGPGYVLESGKERVRDETAIARAAVLLREGAIIGVKGLGGYHLACDARNARAVSALRERKYRKERPFAVMVRDVETAQTIARFDAEALALLQSQARPIVLAPAKMELPEVSPHNADLGVLLAYTPLQHLLFAAGAPDVLVMTSANRSSEPIAYRDDDAREQLAGIADALLVGEREIARRVDDSVAVSARAGTVVLRHARGYAPQSVARVPAKRPILALGADLKNAVALVVKGQTFLSQHIGDLEHYDALQSFKTTIRDLSELYEVADGDDMLIAHDAHPQYRSTLYAADLRGHKIAVQHHRAHIASVLAERSAFDEHVLGFAFDGTGYGDDGTIWGGEVFSGSLRSGFERIAHLRAAPLPGGDAAARFPVQAAAGFLHGVDAPDMRGAPFAFPERYDVARDLIRTNVRVFTTTSVGRLFDAAAALLGFTRPVTFEAQAAMWLEHLARGSQPVAAYPFPFENGELDYRPLLEGIIRDRIAGRNVREIARAFQAAVVQGIVSVANGLAIERIVASGGVFQNTLLLNELSDILGERLWINRVVPPNDGGIPLGQAALAACAS